MRHWLGPARLVTEDVFDAEGNLIDPPVYEISTIEHDGPCDEKCPTEFTGVQLDDDDEV